MSNERQAAARARHGGRTPADRAQNLAREMAVKWVRIYHPDRWEAILDAAYDELGFERKARGRPRKAR